MREDKVEQKYISILRISRGERTNVFNGAE